MSQNIVRIKDFLDLHAVKAIVFYKLNRTSNKFSTRKCVRKKIEMACDEFFNHRSMSWESQMAD